MVTRFVIAVLMLCWIEDKLDIKIFWWVHWKMLISSVSLARCFHPDKLTQVTEKWVQGKNLLLRIYILQLGPWSYCNGAVIQTQNEWLLVKWDIWYWVGGELEINILLHILTWFLKKVCERKRCIDVTEY